jgi:hypothetical protein
MKKLMVFQIVLMRSLILTVCGGKTIDNTQGMMYKKNLKNISIINNTMAPPPPMQISLSLSFRKK